MSKFMLQKEPLMKLAFTLLLFSLFFFSSRAQPCSKFVPSWIYGWSPMPGCNWTVTFDPGGYRYDTVLTQITIDTNGKNRWQIGQLHKTFFTGDSAKGNVIVTDTMASCIPNDTSSFVLRVKRNMCIGFLDFAYHYRLSLRPGDTAIMERSDDSITWKTAFKISDTADTSCHEYYENPISTSNLGTDSMFYRFTLITGPDTNARDGWMLDDFLVIHWFESIKDPYSQDFQLYPNPARTSINLQFTNMLDENADLLLYNSVGTIVKKQTVSKGLYTATIDVSNLPTGIYICTVNTGNGKITRRVSIY